LSRFAIVATQLFENDIAGFGQRFVLQVDDVGQRKLPTDDSPPPASRLLASGKIRRARPEKAPLKVWPHRHQVWIVRLCGRSGLLPLATKISTEGTDSSTSCSIIWRKLLAARAIAMFEKLPERVALKLSQGNDL